MHKYLGSLVILAVVSVACDGSGDDDDNGVPPQISGEIQVNDTDKVGTIDVHKVFSFATNGQGVAYFSPNPNATCDEVVQVLQQTDYDPVNVYAAEKCTLTLRFYYDEAEGFDGITITNDDIRNQVNANCAMEEGVWNRERGDRGWGYVYDGWWWQGGATQFSYTVTDTGTGTVPAFDLDVGTTWNGQFIYDDPMQDPATGTLQGAVEVEGCQKLVQTNLYE